MIRPIVIAIFAATVHMLVPAHAATGAGTTQHHAVQFSKGKTTAQVRGSVKGEHDAEYIVSAGAGQTLAVSSTSKNGSLNFNILPPTSREAMFSGGVQGSKASVVLPADGSYVLQVFLTRNAARRGESAPFTLDVAVTGQPLLPLPAASDARVAGTRFHAAASVPCRTPGADAVASCKAGVVRRSRDGTATVELRSPETLVRNILVVKGQPVASDSAQPMSAHRQGEVLTIRFGSDERYELPDTLLNGG